MAEPIPFAGVLPLSLLEVQIRCVRREIGSRERVYPGMVEAGHMTQARANQELAEMRGVLETLKSLERNVTGLNRALRDFAALAGRPGE